MVERRAEPARAVHLRRQVLDPEPERPEQGGERPVQLVAEAATVSVDHLGDEGVLVEHDRLAEVDAEVLERDGPQVPLVQVGERGRPVGAEALQVPVDDVFVHAATIRGALDGGSADGRQRGVHLAPARHHVQVAQQARRLVLQVPAPLGARHGAVAARAHRAGVQVGGALVVLLHARDARTPVYRLDCPHVSALLSVP